MRRRTVLQTLSSLLFLPFVRVPRIAQAQAPIPNLAYKDSVGTVDFSSLSDRITASGGITYGA